MGSHIFTFKIINFTVFINLFICIGNAKRFTLFLNAENCNLTDGKEHIKLNKNDLT